MSLLLKQKTEPFVILSAVMALVVVGLLSYSAGTGGMPGLHSSQSISQDILALGDIEEWATFEDTDTGCTFRYPAESAIRAGKSKSGIYSIRLQFDIPEAIGYQGMVIQIAPLDETTSLNDILMQIYESHPQGASFDEWLAKGESVSIGKRDGLKTTCMEGSSDFSVIIPEEDKVYVATPLHDMAAVCLAPKAMETFYQILGTLVTSQES